MGTKMQASRNYDVDIGDIDYLTRGDRSYQAHIVRPIGSGPFPAIVEMHGGTWCAGDRTVNEPIARNLARRGVVVASLDFRAPPEAGYPGSVVDVNQGIRWLKDHARQFNSRSELVGAMGSSSGGHLALLNGLRPDAQDYVSGAVGGGPEGATIGYLVALWPVICPFQRHEYMLHDPAAWSEGRPNQQTLEFENAYWGTTERMKEGSPLLLVEGGTDLRLPPVLCVQNTNDKLHPRFLLDRFVDAYGRRGGDVRLQMFTADRYDSLRTQPDSVESQSVFDVIARFIHSQARL